MAEVRVPDALARPGRPLGVAWGVGNALALHPRPPLGAQQGGGAAQGARVHEVRWETTLYEPVYRKLVNESVSVFLGLQRAAAEEGVGAEALVRVSRQYRSIMRDCQEQLEQLADTGAAALAAHYSAQSELLYKLEVGIATISPFHNGDITFTIAPWCTMVHQVIWHLVEILYLESSPGGLVLPHLLHWVSLHFTACEERARSAQYTSAPVHQNTRAPKHQRTITPEHLCTIAPVNHCPILSEHQSTRHRYTRAPVHHNTRAPAHHYTRAPVHHAPAQVGAVPGLGVPGAARRLLGGSHTVRPPGLVHWSAGAGAGGAGAARRPGGYSLSSSGAVQCWCTGLLVHWIAGALDCWCSELLVYWSAGSLDSWCTG